MKNEDKNKENAKEKNMCKHHGCHHDAGGGALYGLGVIGALFYFLQGANTFVLVITGIFKAVFWPAFVVYRVLTILGI